MGTTQWGEQDGEDSGVGACSPGSYQGCFFFLFSLDWTMIIPESLSCDHEVFQQLSIHYRDSPLHVTIANLTRAKEGQSKLEMYGMSPVPVAHEVQ